MLGQEMSVPMTGLVSPSFDREVLHLFFHNNIEFQNFQWSRGVEEGDFRPNHSNSVRKWY